MSDEKLNESPLEVDRIITRRSQGLSGGRPLPLARSRIIKKRVAGRPPLTRRLIIGGDPPDAAREAPPVIIVEKCGGDVIRKIVVKCPCGRHAELLCEYE